MVFVALQMAITFYQATLLIHPHFYNVHQVLQVMQVSHPKVVVHHGHVKEVMVGQQKVVVQLLDLPQLYL